MPAISALSLALLAAPAGMPVVTDGRPAAVVVTADKPTAVARYAAEELAYHVEKATGARLPIVPESDLPTAPAGRIYLGACRAVREAGIDPAALPAEGFVVRAAGGALFIAGDDGGGDPLDADTRAGTLFGVYDWLERAAGVHWLWPGELGIAVPRVRDLDASEAGWEGAPRFFQRKVRPGLSFESTHPALGFTPKAAEQYARELTLFLRRHRMGRSVRMSYGHAFTDWWERYGAEHPEWFQLLPDGRRGPNKKGGRYSMCVSNPELQRQIVALWKAAGGARPSAGPSFVNAVENDILGLCDCPRCRAWDGPEPADYLRFYAPESKMVGSRFVSDRYARFWLAVQQLAAKENPNAVVIGYAYMNYFQAPASGVKLNPNVLIGYCPSGGWFPRTPEEQEWLQRQWSGWRETGARLFSRTNHFLDGYCMPHIFAHQFAADFQHAVRNGLVATDFDSLTGQWATQGPNLYLLMRLHTRPEAPADDLLAEYYAGFGPAAADVRAYFDYWEKRTTAEREQINKAFTELGASRWRTWAKAAGALYPPECFVPAEALLARAAEAAKGEPDAAARVEFLRKGLHHAELCARAAGLLTLTRPDEPPAAEAKKAMDELLAYRRATERDGIGNFNHLAWVEDLSWRLPGETKAPAELYP